VPTTKSSVETPTNSEIIIDRLERIEDRISDMQRIIDLQMETLAMMRSEVHTASDAAPIVSSNVASVRVAMPSTMSR